MNDATANQRTDDPSDIIDGTTPPDGVQAPETHVIRQVPFQELILEYKFWANPRTQTGLGDADIRELADSILSGTTSAGENDEDVKTYAGVRVPLEVVMIKSINGTHVNLVIDGQRRHKAIEVAALPPDTMVPVYDLEPVPIDWTREQADYYLLRALNAVGTRAGLSSYELCESALRLRDSKDKETGKTITLAKIAGHIGRSESWCSKFLAARQGAAPKLMHQWQRGEITDEQFKALATDKDPEQQAEKAKAVVEARRSGDKTLARTLANEQKLIERAKPAAPTGGQRKADKPSAKAAPRQADLPNVAAAPAAKPEPRKPPSFAIVEDLLDMGKRKPPVHEYVKGLMDGVRWAAGLLDAAKLGKPWVAYMQHVRGERAPAKPAKAASKPKAKPASKGKSKPSKKR